MLHQPLGALVGRWRYLADIVTADGANSVSKQSCLFDRRASLRINRAPARAVSDDPYGENEYWCAIRQRVGFRSLSVPRANLPKVGRSYA
jgi:hypothetical protein